MEGQKLLGRSKTLGRDFHLDVFTPQTEPEFMVMMFGGSGITKSIYEERMHTVHPAFHNALIELEKDLSFVFITSPYDIRIVDLDQNEDEQEKWQEHVLEEILPLLPRLPVYGLCHSGGFSLMIHSVLDIDTCYGCGAMGGDKISHDFLPRKSWENPLTLYYNQDDRVYGPNKNVIQGLVSNGKAICQRSFPGGHQLSDYVMNGSFSMLMKQAGSCRHSLLP